MKIPFKFDSLSFSSSHCRPFVSISHLSFSFNNNDSSNEFFYFSKIWSRPFVIVILRKKNSAFPLENANILLFTFFVCLRTNCCPRFKEKLEKKIILSEFHEELHTVLPLSFTKRTRAILPTYGKKQSFIVRIIYRATRLTRCKQKAYPVLQHHGTDIVLTLLNHTLHVLRLKASTRRISDDNNNI